MKATLLYIASTAVMLLLTFAGLALGLALLKYLFN